MTVDFEFHPQKSEANKAKHGIDFEEAQALWNDPDAVEVKLNYPDEERYARIAKLFDEVPNSGQQFSHFDLRKYV